MERPEDLRRLEALAAELVAADAALGRPEELDEATRERLRALGYVD